MDFSLEYTGEQAAFAGEVRSWISANVPDGLVDHPDPVTKTRQPWGKRRELARLITGL